jgi:NTP pyrophosphatase (non-canonical NTP hydrolase)
MTDRTTHPHGQAALFDRWLNKASENIEEWGVQDERTLLLAIQEELGELTQAHLEANAEAGDDARICEELDDLGALLLQLHISRHDRSLSPDSEQ